MLDLANLTPEEQRMLSEAAVSPQKFAEYFLCNPDEEEYDPFIANCVQRRILTSTKKNVWICCMAGDARVINPSTLRPTVIAQAEHYTQTLTFDLRTSSVVWADAQWTASGMKQCLKLELGSGIDLPLSLDHLVFDSKRAWIPAAEVRVGDRILSPSKIRIFGTKTPIDIEKVLDYTLATNQFPDEIFGYTEAALTQFLTLFWGAKGRLLHNQKVVAFMIWDRLLALDLHHLLLRFEIDSRIDEDDNLFIDDSIDQSTFLNLVGVKCPILEVRSPRRWEIVVDIKKLGSRPVYDLSVDHPDHNFIANDTVVHNCSRRSGKSYGMTIMAIWLAITQYNKKIKLFTPSTTQMTAFFDVVDSWIARNPILQIFKAPKGNHDQPHMRRSFITGSAIDGHILGLTGTLQEARRGITADYVFLDEAQLMTKQDWKVVNPILKGDVKRFGKVRGFIAGTIDEPVGHYYEKVFGKTALSDNEEVIYVPITENTDYTQEQRDQLELESTVEEWQTEYLLQIGESDLAVFRKVDVEAAFQYDYEYTIDLVKPGKIIIMGIDWDKGQAGTNIAIIQYDKYTKSIQTIYHEEVPKGEFTYTNACRRALELFDIYQPEWVVADDGQGQMQWETLMLASMESGSRLANCLLKVGLGWPMKITNLQTMEEEKKMTKDFLVGQLQKKFQDRLVIMPADHTAMKNQFLTYKYINKPNQKTKFSSTNEHIIDCHTFCMFAIWTYYEDPMLDTLPASQSMRILNGETMQSFIEPEVEEAMWDHVLVGRNNYEGPHVHRTDLYNPYGGGTEIPF